MKRKGLFFYTILALISYSCAPTKASFQSLPNNRIKPINIVGKYENTHMLSPFGGKDLWHCIDRRSTIVNDSHYVYLYFEDEALIAQLLKGDSIIDQKRIKGTLNDSCFVAKKKRKIIPILPILFFSNSQQIRISCRDSSLLVDEFSSGTTMVVVMGNSTKWNYTYEYERIEIKDSMNTKK